MTRWWWGQVVCVALGLGNSVRLGAQEGAAASVLPPKPTLQWYDLGERGTYGYSRPRPLQSVRNAPGTIARTVAFAARPNQLMEWGATAATTALSIAADEWLLRESRGLARAVNLPRDHPSYNVRVGSLKIVPLPTTLGSAIYFLGDGATSLGVAGGFVAFGAIRHDNRASRTASQITESLLAAGTFTQIIKRVTGRQTPSEATEPRGRWNWFPSFSDYNDNVPGHDAFPSGHLAVATATVEVVARNYPEKRYVRPLGYSLLAMLSFSMVNNGVHWASDYPLAIALGRTVANVSVGRGRTTRSADGSADTGVRPVIGPGRVGVMIPIGR